MTPAALTAAQLAERWQVSDDTIRRMIARGELPRLPGMRQHRIPIRAVEDIECGCSSTEGDGMPSGQKMAEPNAGRSEPTTRQKLAVVLPIYDETPKGAA